MSHDEQQIRQLVSDWMAFTKAGRIDEVLNLMTEDVVFLIAGAPPMIGRGAFAASARGAAGQPSPTFDGTSEIQEVRVQGDWAFMWTKLRVVVTMPAGQMIARSGQTLSVLRKESGVWKLWRDANLLTTEKPAS